MIRGVGTRGAVAINVVTMVGIGPLITIPLVVAHLHGALALVAWVVGALVALCDGLVYAELGSLYPSSGSTYVFVREAFGAERWGRLLAFLFAWQFVLSAPLTIATGYIGFAHYAAYLCSPLAASVTAQSFLAAGIGVLTVVLLYRPIHVVSAFGVALAAVALGTLAAIVAAAAGRAVPAQAFALDPHVGVIAALAAGLGPALVVTLYDYAGYNATSALGDEVRDPARTLPRSILLAIAAVAALYVALQIGVLSVVRWQTLVPAVPGAAPPELANHIAAAVVERAWGAWAARLVTVAVLATAFASTFGLLLAASRVPFAAARDGVFLAPFRRLHPRDRFPHVSLLVLGLLAIPPCFFSLGDVINALTAGITLVGPIAQIVALGVVRARAVRAPFRMALYPLPALAALLGWAYIFVSSGGAAIAYGFVTLGAGTLAFAWRAHRAREWPFAKLAAAAVTLGLFGFTARGAQAAPHAARGAPVPAGGHPTYGHATLVEQHGTTVFERDGAPFFLYGAAFFYERLPRDEWSLAMDRLRDLGINTLDLYVPWNWHELADGNFDFDGRTNPRRDLHEVLRLARAHGFAIVLRPGPVVRNEWRNGGYPAWLLARPEYAMPLHDLLEGRYPPTATLQNAHSDDAAAAWLRNVTHRRYARRWLERVLHEVAPVADRVVAVALDDDQGAYLDNQTYPAPHLTAYLDWLRSVVHGVTGPRELVFINTYQMKVPAASPVWAMGNWYQSDAYALGEHDRAQLEFSFGMLQSRPHQPLMASEFQAGWLEGPGDARPRAAAPSNTALALVTMVGLGVRGIVNFPAQDTFYPAGWEAPFANAFYAWDAALALDGTPAPRAVPTAALGALVVRFGPQLAAAPVAHDAAIAYLAGSFAPQATTNALVAHIARATSDAQRACENAGLACALVDPHAAPATLRRYRLALVPAVAGAPPLLPGVGRALAAFRAAGGRVLEGTPGATAVRRSFAAAGGVATVEGLPGATFAPDPSGRLGGFLTVVNYMQRPLHVPDARVALTATRRVALPAFDVPAHDAFVVPLDAPLRAYDARFGSRDRMLFATCVPRFARDARGHPTVAFAASTSCTYSARIGGVRRTGTVEPGSVASRAVETGAATGSAAGTTGTGPVVGEGIPIRNDAWLPAAPGASVAPNRPGTVTAARTDLYRDGSDAAVLDNGLVRLAIVPAAGARAFLFEDDVTGRNVFTSVGALRDDVALEPALSTSDKIAAFTHLLPAGMFNRTYETALSADAGHATARFRYTAPDVLPAGATYERTVALARGARGFTLDERFLPSGPGDAPGALGAQRAVSVTSLAVGAGSDMTTRTVLGPQPVAFPSAVRADLTSGHALGLYDAATGDLATIAWRQDDVERAEVDPRPWSLLVRLTLAPRRIAHLRFAYDRAFSLADARAALAADERLAVSTAASCSSPRQASSRGIASPPAYRDCRCGTVTKPTVRPASANLRSNVIKRLAFALLARAKCKASAAPPHDAFPAGDRGNGRSQFQCGRGAPVVPRTHPRDREILRDAGAQART